MLTLPGGRRRFEVTHEGDDEAKATTTRRGRLRAEEESRDRHPLQPNDAEAAARRAGEDKGLNAVAFGRAEFIRYEATDTEAGQIVNCVAAGYTR